MILILTILRSLNISSGSPIDMDLDSPFSPGSGSDLSDLFEPPTATPPTASVNKASDSSQWAKIIGVEEKKMKRQNNNTQGQSRNYIN